MSSIVSELSNPPLHHRVALNEAHMGGDTDQLNAIGFQEFFHVLDHIRRFVYKVVAVMVKLKHTPGSRSLSNNQNVVSGARCFADHQTAVDPIRQNLQAFIFVQWIKPIDEVCMQLSPFRTRRYVLRRVSAVFIVIKQDAAKGFLKVAKPAHRWQIVQILRRIDNMRETDSLGFIVVVDSLTQKLTRLLANGFFKVSKFQRNDAFLDGMDIKGGPRVKLKKLSLRQ